MNKIHSNTIEESQYFHVGILKFCLMSLCTLGIYQIYWSYKNWSFVKLRDGSNISPFWRGIFSTLWYYSLLSEISENSNSKANFSVIYKIILAVTYFLLGILWKLNDPYWTVGFLAFIPVLPAVIAIGSLNSSQLIQEPRSSQIIGNLAVYLIGGAFLAFTVLSAFNYFPSIEVVDGSKLSKSDLMFLKEEGLIDDNDQILYFYSSGFFSIKDDGQFISDGYVVSYYRDPEDGELYGGNVPYYNIKNISTVWSSSFFDQTVVKVTEIDNNEFELWLSSEAGRDKLLVKQLMSKWKSATNKVNIEPSQSFD